MLLTRALWDLVPDRHTLKHAAKGLELPWLREEVWDCCHDEKGRPGTGPQAASRLMLAGMPYGVALDRRNGTAAAGGRASRGAARAEQRPFTFEAA